MNKKKAMITTMVLTCSIILLSAIFVPNFAIAKNTEKRVKLITSVKINHGDSLWSIAQEYITDDYRDMNQYISEIKETNGLKSNTIHDGCYIIVPYYTDVTE